MQAKKQLAPGSVSDEGVSFHRLVLILSSCAVTDVAGVVDVGSGANAFKVGDEVAAMLNPFVSKLITGLRFKSAHLF